MRDRPPAHAAAGSRGRRLPAGVASGRPEPCLPVTAVPRWSAAMGASAAGPCKILLLLLRSRSCSVLGPLYCRADERDVEDILCLPGVRASGELEECMPEGGLPDGREPEQTDDAGGEVVRIRRRFSCMGSQSIPLPHRGGHALGSPALPPHDPEAASRHPRRARPRLRPCSREDDGLEKN